MKHFKRPDICLMVRFPPDFTESEALAECRLLGLSPIGTVEGDEAPYPIIYVSVPIDEKEAAFAKLKEAGLEYEDESP